MSTHNICFHGKIRKNIKTFGLKKNLIDLGLTNKCDEVTRNECQ